MSQINRGHESVRDFLYESFAEESGIDLSVLKSATRKEEKANRVHMIRYSLMILFPELSYNELARLTGARDHSTIFNSVRTRAPEILVQDPHLRKATSAMIEEISGVRKECRACQYSEVRMGEEEYWVCKSLSSSNKKQVVVLPTFGCVEFAHKENIVEGRNGKS